MSFEKVVASRLATVDTQATDLLQPIGGASGSGTVIGNPLSSEKFWTSLALVANTTLVGGSFTVEAQGTIHGITGLPFARRVGLDATGTTTLVNLFNSPGMPTPQYILWDVTAAGGITATVAGVGKTIRGIVRGGRRDSFMVYEGRISSVSGNVPGSGVNGITGADKTHILAANSTSTSPSVSAGLDRMYMWDNICYAANVTGCSGTYIINMLGLIDGNTVLLAQTPTITGITKVAFANSFYGCSVRPTAIQFDFVAGGGAGLTADVVYMAVATRGVRHKT